MGPSLPERSARNVLIKASAYDMVQDVVITEATQEVQVPIQQGLRT